MRLRFLVPVLVLGTLALLRVQAHAAEPAQETQAAEGTLVHLVERAERQMPRDRLAATLRVEASGIDPAKVQDEVNRRMQAAMVAAKGVAAVKVESGSYSVYRQPSSPPNATGPAKWVAAQTVGLTSTAFGPALGLIGTLQGQGLTIESLAFDVAPETLRAAEDEMTAQALAAVRARAERVAAGMDMRVARYKALDVGNVTTEAFRPPVPLRMMAAKASAAERAPAAEAGEATAFLTVDAQVVLEAKKAP
jgi:predicted secreted protein